MLLKSFREIDHLVGWYREFLADTREIFVKKKHALYLFVEDINDWRISQEQSARANGGGTP